jgi:hypothetical protein
MRTKGALITLLAWAVAACAGNAPPRLSYEPPTDPPANPGAGYVGRPSADLIWGQLLDRMAQSGLQIDLADPERGIMVGTYSGDAAPYVTCGWILLHGEGQPQQIDASSEASFNRIVGGHAVEIGRDLKLDARLVVAVSPAGREGLVEVTANYVLTKTVMTEGRAGRRQGRAHEIVSFSTGERGVFSKGTVCQPNGALERTALDILPPATQVARRAGPAAARRSTIVQTEIPGDDLPQASFPSDDLGEAGVGHSLSEQSFASDHLEEQILTSSDVAPSAGPDRPPPARACAIDDQTFCAVLEVTDPYRRANEELGLGLEVKRMEAGNPFVDGSGLGLDISLPSYDAYLAVSYFLRDGTVHHVLSGRNRRWPANAIEFLGDSGLGIDQSGEVEMVVAVASDEPLFESPRPTAEAAENYLADLRSRLAEMSGASQPPRIAASLLVITPALQQPS